MLLLVWNQKSKFQVQVNITIPLATKDDPHDSFSIKLLFKQHMMDIYSPLLQIVSSSQTDWGNELQVGDSHHAG